MTLTELRYIIAVAQEKHFGRAADACFVSQPTLSVAVKKLEDELGCALFERCNNEIKITPFGEQIIAQAQKVMAEATVLKDMAAISKDQLTGVLRLGAIYTIGPYLFPTLIPQLKKLAPKMPIAIQEDFTENFRSKLRQGEVDVVILSLPFTEPGIVTLPLYNEPFVVLLPSTHPWQKQKTIDPNALAEENMLLLGQGHCLRDQILSVCYHCRNTITDQHYIGSSLETLRYMVASGLGVTVLPITAAQSKNTKKEPLTYRNFSKPQPKRQIVLAWRKTFPRPKVIDVLRKAVLACKLEGIQPLL
jgi:LysR family hydrogen peroxide-inducible transcriptional activator